MNLDIIKNNKTKKIVFLVGSMGKGGGERVISILANHYAAKDHNVTILMLLKDDIKYELNETITTIFIGDEKVSRFKLFFYLRKKLKKTIKQIKPDVVCSFFAKINFIAISVIPTKKIKLIVSERADPNSDGRSWFTKLVTRILYRRVLVIFQNEYAQSWFSKKIRDNSLIIPNPISVTTNASKKQKQKIVSVGRHEKSKNHQMTIFAFNRYVQTNPEHTLHFYGDGSLRNKLIYQVGELNLSDKVFFHGVVDDIHENIKDAEMFVLSSKYEGQPNALLEAMMMGIPVITTDFPSVRGVVDNGVSGIVVPLDDDIALSRAMDLLSRDEKLRSKLVENGRAIAANYSKDRILRIWDKVILD